MKKYLLSFLLILFVTVNAQQDSTNNDILNFLEELNGWTAISEEKITEA